MGDGHLRFSTCKWDIHLRFKLSGHLRIQIWHTCVKTEGTFRFLPVHLFLRDIRLKGNLLTGNICRSWGWVLIIFKYLIQVSQSLSDYNKQFYSTHPAIFVFLKTILEQQSVNYIKIHYIEEPVVQSRIENEKLEYLYEKWGKYQSGELTRAKYIQTIGYKYQARTDL